MEGFMEMVKAKLILLLAASVLLGGCEPRMTWEKHVIDGHMTGVTAVTGTDFSPSLGIADTVYHAPNGRVFDCGSTPVVARLMIDAQPGMAFLKEVLAWSPFEMRKGYPESVLGNWASDALMQGVSTVTGRKVDAGFINLGGIRVDMPKGAVMLDDIVSMFPFRNNMCYIRLKGSDIRYVLDQMCRRAVLAAGGVRFVSRDGKASDITIGGEPFDDDREYGVAAIDFILDGGDGISLARNARELIDTGVRLMDWMVPYVKSLQASGNYVESHLDGRFTVE